MQDCSAQTLIKPVVYEDFSGYLAEKGTKSLEKHYVYKVPALRITGAVKPYKTLVKPAFAQVQNCSAQTLIKPVIYGGFPHQLANEGPRIIERALRLQGF